MATQSCPQCGASVEDPNSPCPRCGQPETRHCPRCFGRLENGRCARCGGRLSRLSIAVMGALLVLYLLRMILSDW